MWIRELFVQFFFNPFTGLVKSLDTMIQLRTCPVNSLRKKLIKFTVLGLTPKQEKFPNFVPISNFQLVN